MIAEWPEVRKLEEDFNSYTTEWLYFPICVTNGTVALDLALKAFGIHEWDEVIVPNFTYIASANSVRFQNAKVVFTDVSLDDYNISLEEIKKYITSKTRAVIIVHLYWNPVKDIQEISNYCKENNIFLIEDCAQAHWATISERKVWSFWDASCFSFYATKNLGAWEGGITLFRDEIYYQAWKLYYNHGQKEKYYHTTLWHNFRMTDIAAAIANVQLDKLPEMNTLRRKNAYIYDSILKDQNVLQIPKISENIYHVFHQYTVLVLPESQLSRDEILLKLQEKWIPTAIHYPITIKNQPYYKDLWYTENESSNSYYLSKNIFSLPIYPWLTEEEVTYIAKSLLEIIQK